MTPQSNVQATFCATLVDEWARAGVAHAVIAPGSRSTPLALALAGDGRVRVHVHHDERAAAFLALGIGLASGVPAVLLTTSGTAAVELHPAVVEASQAGVPMIVGTADRPPELQSVGAAQSVDQTHLFGRAPRWFADPGVADMSASSSWRSLAARAFAEATTGPVHLNLPFREPLLGDAGVLPDAREGAWHTASRPSAFEPHRVPGRRGVLVAGGGIHRPEALLELAGRLGWPVLADPRSGCRVPGSIGAFDALLRDETFASAHRPDVVVRLGFPPASKPLASWVAASGAEEIVVAPTWVDPDHTATSVVLGDPSAWCDAADGESADVSWLTDWRRADEAAQRAFDEVLVGHAEPTEPFVARTVAATASNLVVASSMPVRDVEWYAPAVSGRIYANRGANGIDGVVSTAVGVAIATAAPVTTLVGDIAFLHDSNALLGLRDRELDLTVVVVDNRGGGIFSFLPQAAALDPGRFEQLFGTPHDVDLARLAEAHGLPTTVVSRAADLRGALEGEGSRIVLVPTDRAANVDVHAELNAAVRRAIA